MAYDKPAGWLVIPGRGEPEITLRQVAEREFGRVWVVHRLDRGTSGVVLFARDADAHRTLNTAFERHEVRKRYLAIVVGAPPAELRVDTALAPARRGKMRPARPGESSAKAAATRVRRVEQLGRYALVEVEPETGRTHQIRVHLRSAGFPLAVDPDYGDAEPIRDEAGRVILDRTPLHAVELSFVHPTAGVSLAIRAPFPADMEQMLAFARRSLDRAPSGDRRT